jgi:hypothetical protein
LNKKADLPYVCIDKHFIQAGKIILLKENYTRAVGWSRQHRYRLYHQMGGLKPLKD